MQRITLAVLAVQGLVLGCWAAFAPRSLYDDFPGFGHHWVVVDGPYNEHLVRDVGSLFLALDRWPNVVVPAVSVLLPAYLLVAPAPRSHQPARSGD